MNLGLRSAPKTGVQRKRCGGLTALVAVEYAGTTASEVDGIEVAVLKIGGDFVALDAEIDDQEDRWQRLVEALLEMQRLRAKRGPGRPPGWGLQEDVLLAKITDLRQSGRRITRQVLADELCYTKDTIKRACRRAGLHGRL